MPKVSAVMTVYNGKNFISESIESIQGQTFTDWEFIIINELGSDDGTREIIEEYAKKDPRIILIQNETRLGIAESLNKGIRFAQGQYIARVDVDDPSYPNRFEKQVLFLDNHPEIGFCGALQRTVSPQSKNVLYVATDYNSLKAEMLFGCQISHCSVMLRRQLFIENNWYYDSRYLAEDFELWTRIMNKTKYENIGEVLVDHRWGFENVSIEKGERLHDENRRTIAALIEREFRIDTSKYDIMLFSTWRNNIRKYAVTNLTKFITQGFNLLSEIEKNSYHNKNFDRDGLLKVLCMRWNWIVENSCLSNKHFKNINCYIPRFNEGYQGSFKDKILNELYQQNLIKSLEASDADIVESLRTQVNKVKNYFSKNPTIIVYGVGQRCKDFFEEYSQISLSKYPFKLQAFSDGNLEKMKDKEFMGIPLVYPYQLSNYNYDFIIISTDTYYEEIFELLTRKYFIPEEKILPLSALYLMMELNQRK